jgi:serine protease
VSGAVSADGLPVCALVLANGQHRFSCSGDGTYRMSVPRDSQGRITLFAFADGFEPYERVFGPLGDIRHAVNLRQAASRRSPSVELALSPGTPPGRVQVSGTVSSQQIPVCALMLANGQAMFSCGEDLGRFSLNVPVDRNGEITLFAFASGFAPFKTVIPARVRVSGSVIAGAGSDVDTDVNDPYAPYASNDFLSIAQPIRNPSSIGGYVNAPFRGPSGRSFESGDSSDIFSARLLAGQTLRLIVGDAVAGDLDLFLMDLEGRLLESSEGIGDSEQIMIPGEGDYFVEVFAYSGASTYVLTVGRSAFQAHHGALSVTQDLVPGEVLLKTYRGRDRMRSADWTEKLRMLGLGRVRGLPHELSVYRLHPTETLSGRRQPDDRMRIPVAYRESDIEPQKIRTIRAVKALRRHAAVDYAEPNRLLRALQEPSDPYYGNQWHYRSINLPRAWDTTTGGSDVVVAVVDTGVVSDHPDLRDNLVGGYDFVSDPAFSLDGDGIDPDPEDPGDPVLTGVAQFHGTHVAGTVGAAGNNGIGVAGVAWNAAIMPLRALGLDGAGTTYDILQAVRYAAGLENDSGTVPPVPADIINLSLGGASFSAAEQDVYAQVSRLGTIVVAAAGNAGAPAPTYPASYDGVVSVGAVTIGETRAPYSNFGPTIDLVAPGGSLTSDADGDGYPDGVLSTGASGGAGPPIPNYVFMEGTSMAAPHVAGVAALMRSVNPDLTYGSFMQLLAAGALTRDLGAPGRDDSFGWGVMDAAKAVTAAGGAPQSGSPRLTAVPAALNFGVSETAVLLRISSDGDPEASLSKLTVADGWLSVEAIEIDELGLGTYQARVDRTSLGEGTYSSRIGVTAGAETLDIPVIMEVVRVEAESDAGRQYVLLIDAETGVALDQRAVDAASGRYAYSFETVPIGRYRILSGSDLDNDGFICDEVESCGAYPTLDSSQRRIPIAYDVTGLDFVVAFSPEIYRQQASSQGSRKIPAVDRQTKEVSATK